MFYSMHEATERLGVTPRTLRFWQAKGLIKPVRRGYQRYWSPKELQYAEWVKDLQQCGFTLEEIRDIISMLRLLDAGAPPELEEEAEEALRGVHALLWERERHLRAVRERLKQYF